MRIQEARLRNLQKGREQRLKNLEIKKLQDLQKRMENVITTAQTDVLSSLPVTAQTHHHQAIDYTSPVTEAALVTSLNTTINNNSKKRKREPEFTIEKLNNNNNNNNEQQQQQSSFNSNTRNDEKDMAGSHSHGQMSGGFSNTVSRFAKSFITIALLSFLANCARVMLTSHNNRPRDGDGSKKDAASGTYYGQSIFK